MNPVDRCKLLLENDSSTCPISSIEFDMDRADITNNVMQLRLYEAYREDGGDNHSNQLKRTAVSDYAEKVLGSQAEVRFSIRAEGWNDLMLHEIITSSTQKELLERRTPDLITIRDPMKARTAIQNLFESHAMSNANRADIEPMLREFETSVRMAIDQVDSISSAQQDIIRDFVGPYIEHILAEAPDAPTALLWVRQTISCSRQMPSSLNVIEESKREDVFGSLVVLAKVCNSKANLEDALKQSGTHLPSASQIKNLIEKELIHDSASYNFNSPSYGQRPVPYGIPSFNCTIL